MGIVNRSLLLFALLALVACTTPRHTDAAAARGNCNNVRCATCPDGQTAALKPPDCCKCVPVDTSITNCATIRCAACPPGQTPSLQPPDCCKCVASQ
jgi:hypothetical protein